MYRRSNQIYSRYKRAISHVFAVHVMNRLVITCYRLLVPRTLRGKKGCIRGGLIILGFIAVINIILLGSIMWSSGKQTSSDIKRYLQDESDDFKVPKINLWKKYSDQLRRKNLGKLNIPIMWADRKRLWVKWMKDREENDQMKIKRTNNVARNTRTHNDAIETTFVWRPTGANIKQSELEDEQKYVEEGLEIVPTDSSRVNDAQPIEEEGEDESEATFPSHTRKPNEEKETAMDNWKTVANHRQTHYTLPTSSSDVEEDKVDETDPLRQHADRQGDKEGVDDGQDTVPSRTQKPNKEQINEKDDWKTVPKHSQPPTALPTWLPLNVEEDKVDETDPLRQDAERQGDKEGVYDGQDTVPSGTHKLNKEQINEKDDWKTVPKRSQPPSALPTPSANIKKEVVDETADEYFSKIVISNRPSKMKSKINEQQRLIVAPGISTMQSTESRLNTGEQTRSSERERKLLSRDKWPSEQSQFPRQQQHQNDENVGLDHPKSNHYSATSTRPPPETSKSTDRSKGISHTDSAPISIHYTPPTELSNNEGNNDNKRKQIISDEDLKRYSTRQTQIRLNEKTVKAKGSKYEQNRSSEIPKDVEGQHNDSMKEGGKEQQHLDGNSQVGNSDTDSETEHQVRDVQETTPKSHSQHDQERTHREETTTDVKQNEKFPNKRKAKETEKPQPRIEEDDEGEEQDDEEDKEEGMKPLTTSTTSTQPFPLNKRRKRTGKLKQLPSIDLDDLEDKKPRVDLVIFVLTSTLRFNRRKAVRETWWTKCKAPQAVCLFATDGYVGENMYDEIKREKETYKDILFLPTEEGLNFGLRLMYMMEWASAKYTFDFFLRVDDDYFLCIEKLLNELPYQHKNKVAWGYWHCDSPYVVYLDESLMLLSHDLIETFLSWDDQSLRCHPYGDQQLALWLNYIKGLNAFHDSRLHHDPPASKSPYLRGLTNICDNYVGLHGTYPEDMRRFWQRANDGRKKVSSWLPMYPNACKYRPYFDWRKIKFEHRHRPELCINIPGKYRSHDKWPSQQSQLPREQQHQNDENLRVDHFESNLHSAASTRPPANTSNSIDASKMFSHTDLASILIHPTPPTELNHEGYKDRRKQLISNEDLKRSSRTPRVSFASISTPKGIVTSINSPTGVKGRNGVETGNFDNDMDEDIGNSKEYGQAVNPEIKERENPVDRKLNERSVKIKDTTPNTELKRKTQRFNGEETANRKEDRPKTKSNEEEGEYVRNDKQRPTKHNTEIGRKKEKRHRQNQKPKKEKEIENEDERRRDGEERVSDTEEHRRKEEIRRRTQAHLNGKNLKAERSRNEQERRKGEHNDDMKEESKEQKHLEGNSDTESQTEYQATEVEKPTTESYLQHYQVRIYREEATKDAEQNEKNPTKGKATKTVRLQPRGEEDDEGEEADEEQNKEEEIKPLTTSTTSTTQPLSLTEHIKTTGKLKQLPLIDLDDLEDKKPRVDLVIFVLTSFLRFDRRKAIRETWWTKCKESKAVCFFATDGYVDETMYDEIIREKETYKDILFLPTEEGLNFGLRLIYMMEWASAKYTFDFFLRVDDDYFLCIEKLLNELPYQHKNKVAWGYWHCDSPYVVYLDESLMLLSHDLIETFLSWDYQSLRCHPYGDQQLALWLNYIKGLNAFHDSRLHHDPPASKSQYFQGLTNICEGYIGLHGTYPEDMRRFWQRANDGRKKVSSWLPMYPNACRYRPYFDWRKIKFEHRHRPELCINEPRWTRNREMWVGREGLLTGNTQ